MAVAKNVIHSIMKASHNNNQYQLSSETIKALEELCMVLKPIYLEMKRQSNELGKSPDTHS